MSATHLLDTSAIIAMERGTPLDDLDEFEWVIAAMTLAELNVGLLRSPSAAVHQQRLQTFQEACSRPTREFDETVARTYAELRVWAGSIGVRPSVADCIIAATAATDGLTLVTFDQGFRSLAGFDRLELHVL